MFRPLTKDNIYDIIDLLIADVNKRLADKEISIELTPEAKNQVVEGGYDPTYGARPLKALPAEECGDAGGEAYAAGRYRRRGDHCHRRGEWQTNCKEPVSVRIIFHIDVNSAYLSWTAVEQLKNGARQTCA